MVAFLVCVLSAGFNVHSAEVEAQQQEIIEKYIELLQNDQATEKEILERMQHDVENGLFFDFTSEMGLLVVVACIYVGIYKCIKPLCGEFFRYRAPGAPYRT